MDLRIMLILKKKWQHCARWVYYLSEITNLRILPASPSVNFVLVESRPFCMTLDLQLSFYCPLCYNIRAHCPLTQCLRTTRATLAGAHSYFVVSFKCDGKNSCNDLIPNPPMSICFPPWSFTVNYYFSRCTLLCKIVTYLSI